LDPWNRDKSGLKRSHHITFKEAYIDNLVERFGLQNANTITTPLVPGAKSSAPRRLRNCKTCLETTIANSSVLCGTLCLPRDQTLASPLASSPNSSGTLVIRTWRQLDASYGVSKGRRTRLNLGGAVTDLVGFTDSEIAMTENQLVHTPFEWATVRSRRG